MPILVSPLQLEGYYVQELHFVTRQPPEGPTPLSFQFGLHPQMESLFGPDEMTINTQIAGAGHTDDPSRLVSIVQIESRTPPEVKFPYDFRVVMVGYFRLGVEVPDAERSAAIEALKHTAASVLYSAARELIASATARGPYPAALLPTVVIQLDPPTKEGQPAATKKGSRKGAKKKAAKKGRAKKQQR